MHSTNTIYNQLLAAGAKVEYKLKLNGVDYGCPPVRSMSAVYQAFSEDMPTVGCCIGAQLDVVMDIPSATIPKGAQLTPYARLNNGTQQSGWIAKKTYWISTRDDRSVTGRMQIKAFDAMGKTEQSFLTGGDVGLWPQTDIDVVDEICERIGVTLDNGTRSILTAGYDIPLPAELTMREVLGRIGTFYCGNWVITDDNTLRLLQLGQALPGTGVSVTVASRFITAPTQPAYSMVRVYVSDQTTYESGTDTGAVLDVDCPWATQDIADDMLERIRGYAYVPFEAGSAKIHPAVELGDAISIGNVSGILYRIEDDFRVSGKAYIAAPHDGEPTEEFPYLTAERKLARKISGVTASLSILETEILQKISSDEAMSMIDLELGTINLSLSDNQGTTSFVLKRGNVTLDTEVFDLHVKSVNVEGTIVADAINLNTASITGRLTASNIDTTDLHVSGANIDNLSVTNAQIQSLYASKIVTGSAGGSLGSAGAMLTELHCDEATFNYTDCVQSKAASFVVKLEGQTMATMGPTGITPVGQSLISWADMRGGGTARFG